MILDLIPLIVAILLLPNIKYCFIKFVVILGNITPKDIDKLRRKYER